MKGVSVPQQDKNRFFSMKQASGKKDVKRVFGLLKKSFNMLAITDR
jgi:hypothetical protein